jgi:hypothetical protein
MVYLNLFYMRNALQNFLIYSSFVVIAPFLAAIIRFKKLEYPLRYLAILIFFDFFTEAAGHVLFFFKMNNHFLWPVFIPIEFGLLGWIYRLELRQMIIARLIPLLIVFFTAYVLIDWICAKQGGLSPVPHFIEGVLMLYFVLCYYYKNLKAPLVMHLERTRMFWLSTGLFIYFSADSIIFIFSNYLQSFSLHFFDQVWVIHAIFNVLLYVFYTLALCLTPKNQS